MGCMMQVMEQVIMAVVAPGELAKPPQIPELAISYQALAQPVLMLQVWRAQVPWALAAAIHCFTAAIQYSLLLLSRMLSCCCCCQSLLLLHVAAVSYCSINCTLHTMHSSAHCSSDVL